MLKVLHRLEPGETAYSRNRHRYAMRSAFRSCVIRAAKKGVLCTITFDQLMNLGYHCALSGIAFRDPEIKGHPGPYSPSVDRIRPEEGYVPGNVRLILNGLNSMKGNGTDEDMFLIMIAVLEKQLCSNGKLPT